MIDNARSRRLAGLVLGLALGLVLALASAWAWRRLIVMPAGEALRLATEAEVGPFGPIILEWTAEAAGSSAEDTYIIDGQIAVEASIQDARLSLRPQTPLLPGEHKLSYLPPQGDPIDWEFQVRQPDPMYLKEAGGLRGLYRWRSGERLLLSEDHLVTDYAPTRDGEALAYAAANSEGGTDIWWVDRSGQGGRRLLSCQSDRCDQLAWSPEGDRLAFSRESADLEGRPRLWTVDVAGEAAPLFQDENRLGTDPTWSPDGRYLAFYDPAVSGVRLLDIDTVREQVVPNRTGVSGGWSADSQRLYLPLLVFRGEEPVTHLYRLEVEGRNLQQVLGERGGWRQLGEPALGLDGPFMALAGQRGSAGAGLALYLIRLEDYDVQPLAEDPRYSYGGPSWDVHGRQLLFQRFPRSGVGASPDILLWQLGESEPSLLIEGAGSAKWLH